MTSKYAHKHHIKKSETFIHWKNFLVRKTAKMARKGPKIAVFGPGGPNFAEIKKRLGHSITFTQERLYTEFQKFGSSVLRYGQTDRRTGLKA